MHRRAAVCASFVYINITTIRIVLKRLFVVPIPPLSFTSHFEDQVFFNTT